MINTEHPMEASSKSKRASASSSDSTEEALKRIKRLPDDQLSSYKPFFLGNDRPLTEAELAEHAQSGEFVLVRTALFRNIDIACKLSSTDVVPKIIVIDNSRLVKESWETLQHYFFEHPTITAQEALDPTNEDSLINLFFSEPLASIKIEKDLLSYLRIFFERYNFDYVKQVIMNVTVIEQSWGDIATLRTINEIYFPCPIVAYVSNIIEFLSHDEVEVARILQSLDALQPSVSFHTNLDETTKTPTKCYVCRSHSPCDLTHVFAFSDKSKHKIMASLPASFKRPEEHSLAVEHYRKIIGEIKQNTDSSLLTEDGDKMDVDENHDEATDSSLNPDGGSSIPKNGS